MAYIRCSGNIGGSLKVRTASGAIASFETNLVAPLNSLKCEINAKQDLHGYDHPWVGGAGKNLVPQFRDSVKTQNGITATPQSDGSIRLQGTSTSQSNFLISMIDYVKELPSGTYTFSIGNYQSYVYAQIVASEHTLYSYQAQDTYTYNNDLSMSRLDIGITGGAYGVPIDVTIYPQLETGSQATAYEPYENICPIDGFTECNIVNTDNDNVAELFELDDEFRGRVNFNQLVKNGNFEGTTNWSVNNVSQGTISASNNKLIYTIISANASQSVVQQIPLVNGHKYIRFATITANKATRVRVANYYSGSLQNAKLYDLSANARTQTSDIFVSTYTGNADFYTYVNVLTTLSTDDYVTLENYNVIDLTAMFGSTIADYIYNLEQANAGAGVEFFKSFYPDDYYAYNTGTDELVGKAIPITVAFGQTVYGGVYDANRGKVRITHVLFEKAVADMNNWDDFPGWINSGARAILETEGVYTVNGNVGNTFGTNFIGNNDVLFLPKASYGGLTQTQWMANYPDLVIQFVMPLGTPIEIDVSELSVETLMGINNIFHDCNGDTEVKYLYKEAG